MTFKKLETEALKLSDSLRAQLAKQLLLSLEETEDSEVDQIWAEEAAHRYRELRDNPEAGIPAEEVFRELRAKFG